MAVTESTNTPNLEGWGIGAAAGLVAFGVSIVVGKFDLTTSAFIGAMIAAVVGLILGMPWSASTAARRSAVAVPSQHAAAPVAAVAPAAPVAAAPVAVPAAFVSMPAEPAPAAVAPAEASSDGPVRMTAPRNGKGDDLKEIEGIGPAMEKLVNELGFWHFDQIAGWSEADVAWVDANMKGFKGRITRDKWVAQAKLIVSEGLEAFRVRAKTNDY